MIKKRDNLFYQTHKKETDKVKFPSDEDILNYAKGEYKKIFENYDKSKHRVQRRSYDEDGNILKLINRDSLQGSSVDVPSGMYEFTNKEFEIYFSEYNLPERNDYIDINNGMDKFKEHIKKFFEMEDTFKNSGYPYTDSSLLYGKPGTGKTFTIMHSIDEILDKHDVRCFYIPGHITDLEKVIRFGDDLKKYKKVLIIEEIDERGQHNIETLVNFLDGYTRWENTYTIGTTNHPHKLPAKLVKRPGRFSTIIKAKLPDESGIKKFLEEKNIDFKNEHIATCHSNNMSYAHLNEITKLVKLKDMSISKAVQKMKDQNKRAENNFADDENKIGLGRK